MQTKLTKRYGLFTAIAMVVGIVIGSGVFFKAESILHKTGGNLPLGITAWIIGGLIMVTCVYMFSVMARKYEKVNGIVDYAEATVGKGYAYYMGWFLTTTYYPTLTSVLAWLSARYTMVLFGSDDITGGTCLALSGLYLIGAYVLNALSPRLAGKFQVTTTVMKLIPLLLMAIVGTAVGIANGVTVENFTKTVDMASLVEGYFETPSPLFSAVVATAFAYEGWIIATSINAELKDAKKNLPIALISGSIIIICIYIFYYIGLAGAVDKEQLIKDGPKGVSMAFVNIFGNIGGTALVVFIVISCLGTLNGLMLGCVRGMYSIAVRGQGPASETFSEVDSKTNMPSNSTVLGLLFAELWLFYFFGANLRDSIFGIFTFDSSELPIVTLYALYIPIFIMFIKRAHKEVGGFKGIAAPIVSTAAALFMVVAAFYAHGKTVFSYLAVFAAIMLVGALLKGKRKK